MGYEKKKVDLTLNVLKVYREENYGSKDLQRLQLERWDQGAKTGQIKLAKRIYWNKDGEWVHAKQTLLNKEDVHHIIVHKETVELDMDGKVQPALPQMHELSKSDDLTDDDIPF